MSDSWIKIQDYSASAWKMQRNFIIPELEESQLSLKVISFQSCPFNDTAPLVSVLIALVGGTGLSESKGYSKMTLSSFLGPSCSLPCTLVWHEPFRFGHRLYEKLKVSLLGVFRCCSHAIILLWICSQCPCSLPTQILGKPVSTEVQCSCMWVEKVTPDNASSENRSSFLWPLYCSEMHHSCCIKWA